MIRSIIIACLVLLLTYNASEVTTYNRLDMDVPYFIKTGFSRLIPIEIEIHSPKLHKQMHLESEVGTSTPYNITFQCEAPTNTTKCLLAKEGYIAAAKRIAKQITFRRTIKIQAIFGSFCKAQVPNCKNTLGSAKPASYVTARTTDEAEFWYYYPQSLIKQAASQNIEEFDIIANFNSDFDFYFSTESVAIKPTQTDFEFVVAHEFTHGLGFDTGWQSWPEIFSSDIIKGKDYLAPFPFVTVPQKIVSASTVGNWQPLTIFDRFIYDTKGVALMERAKKIFSYNKTNANLKDFVQKFEESGAPFEAAKEIFKLASTSLSMTFTAQDGTVIPLHTKDTYMSGTSIAHVDVSFLTTSDFLMVPAVDSIVGKTLDMVITTAGGKSGFVYGPKMVSLMSTLGYLTAIKSKPFEVVILLSVSNPLFGSALEKSHSVGVILVLMLVNIFVI